MKNSPPVTSGSPSNAPLTSPRRNPREGPARVLVVDDEPTIRLGVEYSLITEGYEVQTADDGDEAIERMVHASEEEMPDAVVLDLRMPGADGMEVMRRVAAAGRVIPVAIASAYIDSPTAFEAVELGVVDFLKKPITPHQDRSLVAPMLSEEIRFGAVADADSPEIPEEAPANGAAESASISAARCCLRRRHSEKAVRLLEQEDPERHRDVGLWLMIANQLSHSADGTPKGSGSESFYRAANLLDFLAFE